MSFEVIQTEDGYRWQVRDEHGEIVKIRPGRIHLPPDPEADRRVRAAWQEVLRQMYEEEHPTGA